jgi:hypothetical protein
MMKIPSGGGEGAGDGGRQALGVGSNPKSVALNPPPEPQAAPPPPGEGIFIGAPHGQGLQVAHSVPRHLGPMWFGLFHKKDQRRQRNKHDR